MHTVLFRRVSFLSVLVTGLWVGIANGANDGLSDANENGPIVESTVQGKKLKLIGRENRLALTEETRAMGFRNRAELRAYFEIAEVTTTDDNRTYSRDELAATGFVISNGTTAVPWLGIEGKEANNRAADNSGGIANALSDLATDFGDPKKWIALGLKIWEVVKNNQPIANVTTQTISVLPQAKPDWQMMETWQGPNVKSYTIAAKNLFGSTVVSHKYTVAHYYGGSFNGHGNFLANATIIPSDVQVSWGFSLDSSVNVGTPLNMGTKADPIPGIDLSIDWKMSSMLKKLQGRDQFYVRGDGVTTHVNP